MSIHKDHFEALLNRTKSYEFRRRFSNINENFLCVLYVSNPVKAILGIAEFKPVKKDRIDKLVSLIKKDKYSNMKNVKNYFKGCNYGYALSLIKIKKLKNFITLNDLRGIIPGFMPPQSYFSLDNIKYKEIKYLIFKNEP